MVGSAAAATQFHALHAGPDLLILPNAWDAASARLMQEVGAKAVATSSAAVAWSHGFADGHHLPIARLVATVEEIARVISAPLSVDAEGGYSDDPALVGENVSALVNAGAVGINLEDGREPHELHLRKVEAAREAGERAGVALFINARVDVYLKKLAAPEAAAAEVIRRGLACKEAGASGLFAAGVSKIEDIEAIAAGVALALNVLAWPGLPKAAELKRLGVRRLSAGNFVFDSAASAARAAAQTFLRDGESGALAASGAGLPNWNALFRG